MKNILIIIIVGIVILWAIVFVLNLVGSIVLPITGALKKISVPLTIIGLILFGIWTTNKNKK